MYIIIFIFLLSFIVADSKIVASDGNLDDRFGKAVSLSENWLAVGANRDDDNGSNSGSVYVYKKDNLGNWKQIHNFTGEVINDNKFGSNDINICCIILYIYIYI